MNIRPGLPMGKAMAIFAGPPALTGQWAKAAEKNERKEPPKPNMKPARATPTYLHPPAPHIR
jgi:hypothetical protein